MIKTIKKAVWHVERHFTNSAKLILCSLFSLLISQLLGCAIFEQGQDLIVSVSVQLIAYLALQIITLVRYGTLG